MKSRLGSGRFHGSKSPVAWGCRSGLQAVLMTFQVPFLAEGAEGSEGDGLSV